jgi:tetratricopeptide (TPR) repeat protein
VRAGPRIARICWAIALAAGVLAAASGAAVAQPAPATSAQPAPGNATLAAARRHFELGTAAFEARDYRTALRELESAVQLVPSAELWFDIARAHEELGEHAAARSAYERYLRDRVDVKDEAEVRARIERLAQLEARAAAEQAQREASREQRELGSLTVHVSQPGALVSLDGRSLGRAPIDDPLSLAPGRYRLDVVAPDRVPSRSEVDVSAGMLTAAYADLAPLTRDRPAARSRVATWIALALAGGAAIGFGAFTAASISDEHDGDRAGARRWGQRADLALGGAVLCALSATLLYFVEGSESTVELNPRAGFGR